MKRAAQWRIKFNTVAFTLVLVMFFCSIYSDKVNAATKTLTVDQAMAMALKNSDEYSSNKSKLLLAKVQYVQSVKKIKLKQKNQRTLKWSPLLSFKLPEKANLSEEFEYTYKPLELQSSIDVLNHKLNNVKFGVYEKVGIEFCKVYELQEKIKFTNDRIASTEDGLKKNKARLKLGEATQADVDNQQAALDKLKDSLATDTRNLETEKRKLGDIIGVDISVGYRFSSPFIDVDITEQMLPDIIDYTLDNDHDFYNTKMNTANGQLALNTNYELMKKQYGGKLNSIDSFVNQAKRGEKVDGAAFKLKYDELLNNVDSPWVGKKRILFIKFPKDFLKGRIDGVNYVEDEPYALYEATTEYASLLKDERSAEKELRNSVDEAYRNYITARLAVKKTKEDIDKLNTQLAKYRILNNTGKMTFEEYTDAVKEYEEDQLELLVSQSEYSQILYTFDRLTCGSVTSLLKGTNTSLSSGSQGMSYVVEDEGQGVYYYIRSLVNGNVFELGLSISDDFQGSITHYELFIGDQQIGTKTPVDKSIRHLGFDLDNVESAVKIRVWDGDKFVDDCIIDPQEYTGKLAVTIARRIETDEVTRVADYTINTGVLAEMTCIHINPKAGEMIASYNIKNEEGVFLSGDGKIPVNNDFNYLGITDAELEHLTICFYDKEGAVLYEAKFRTSDMTIHKKDM